MSVKIFDAYRFPRDLDVFTFGQRARELANPVRDRLDAKELVERAADIATIDALIGHPSRESASLDLLTESGPVALAAMEYADSQRATSRHSAFHDPHRFELSLVAGGSGLGVKAFMSRDDYRQVMEQLCSEFDGVEYHYQDQTDRPDTISEREWHERRVFWEESVGDKTWLESGLSFSLRPEQESVMLFPNEVRPHADTAMIPDRAQRARNASTALVLRAARPHIDPSRLMEWVDVSRYPQELLDRIEASLPDVTLDALFEPLPQSKDTPIAACLAQGFSEAQSWLPEDSRDGCREQGTSSASSSREGAVLWAMSN